MICGTVGAYANHLQFIDQVLGKAPGAKTYAAMNILLLAERVVALADTHVNDNPDAEQLAEITLAAAAEMRRLNMEPKAALLSRSNFSSGRSQSGAQIEQALALIRDRKSVVYGKSVSVSVDHGVGGVLKKKTTLNRIIY